MQTKYFILLLLLLNGVLIHQVLLPVYSGESSALYASSGKSIAQIKQDIANYEAAIGKADQVIANAKKMKENYQKVTKEQQELMKAMIPDDINQVKLHSEISSILTANGFSSEKLGISKKGGAVSIPGVSAYSISFDLQDADYERLKAFLSIMERSRRLIAIKSIEVSPPVDGEGGYKFTISSETYHISK